MPSKPNYNFQRAERDRAKKAKKEERLQEKKQQAAANAAHAEEPAAAEGSPDPSDTEKAG